MHYSWEINNFILFYFTSYWQFML